MTIEDLASVLHREQCSCVIYNRGALTFCHQRGVRDLYQILTGDPAVLSGAMVADKVIGKGAAALMILGGVRSVYADVISRPALDLLSTASVAVIYRECVPNIINRMGTGICPVESLCEDCVSANDCFPLIERFINETNR